MVRKMELAKTLMSRAWTNDTGFTLFELIVVMAIMALVVSAMPSVYRTVVAGYEVKQYANNVADAARRLRLQARETGRSYHIAVDAEADTLTVPGFSLPVPDDVSLSFEPVEILRLTSSEGIDIYSSGANSGGRLLLSKDQLEVAVVFDWASGSVEVEQ